MKNRRTCWAVVDPKTMRIETWSTSRVWVLRKLSFRQDHGVWLDLIAMRVKWQMLIQHAKYWEEGPGLLAIPA